MSNSKHTPGPWTVQIKQDHDVAAINAKKRFAIALVVVRVANELSEQGLANAKLMAAAPDLLEALIEAVTQADKDYRLRYGAVRTDECQAVYDKCVAAIKKATG